MSNGVKYVVTYSITDITTTSGFMAYFDDLYPAKKYIERASLALKNSGLYGTVNLSEGNFPIMVEDPVKFFEEY